MKKLALSLLGSVLTLGTTTGLSSPATAQSPLFVPQGDSVRMVPQNQTQVQLSYAPVVKETSPAVVNVFTSRTVIRPSSRDFFDEMFGMRRAPRERTESSLGSGVIVRGSGIIVTNAHVVKGADELKVVLTDRREFEAEIIAQDDQIDLAILRVDTKGESLPYLPILKNDDLEVGDIVLAIGNPFGVGQTVTSGIISALGRTNVADFSAFTQTDAAINPGNSGGALVNLNGELVGVNTQIASRSGGSNGVGFAIPAELVARAVESTLTDGKIIRPWLGARTNAVDSALAASLGLDRARGAIIAELYPDGPADKAGLKERDIILSLAGTDVFDEAGLNFKLATLEKGSRVDAKIWRDGGERILRLTTDVPQESPARDERYLEGVHPLDGATVVNLSPALGEELGIDPYLSGVMVLSVERGSAASNNRFRPGHIVVDVNESEIFTTRQLEKTLEGANDPENWAVTVARNGRLFNVPIRWLPRVN